MSRSLFGATVAETSKRETIDVLFLEKRLLSCLSVLFNFITCFYYRNVFNYSRRIIGIRHRIKQTSVGEARPTQLYIWPQAEKFPTVFDKTLTLNMETDTDEIDWAHGRLPVTYRKVTPEDTLEGVLKRHIKWRKIGADEDQSLLPEKQKRWHGKVRQKVTHLPVEYSGLQKGDIVVMILGGSGGDLLALLSNQAKVVGASIYAISAHKLAENRVDLDKDNDGFNLVALFCRSPEEFYPVEESERNTALAISAYKQWEEAQQERIKYAQRLFQTFRRDTFASIIRYDPERDLDDQFTDYRDSNEGYQVLDKAEQTAKKRMEKALQAVSIYREYFAGIEGCGPSIAGRLISKIVDIRYFWPERPVDMSYTKWRAKGEAKLKAYCGVHVMQGGRFGDRPARKQFVRRRSGEENNWTPEARKAFWLFASDQCIKRPNSTWGKRLKEYKASFRLKYPEPVEEMVIDPLTKKEHPVKRYTDGHIHKMAVWRTASRMCEQLFRVWTRLERNRLHAHTEEREVA